MNPREVDIDIRIVVRRQESPTATETVLDGMLQAHLGLLADRAADTLRRRIQELLDKNPNDWPAIRPALEGFFGGIE